MKKFCKIISIFITGWFIAMTIPANNIVENAKAEEVEVDEQFINYVLEQLTDIKPDVYWMGREYGTAGEREAARILENLWDDYISEGLIYLPAHKEEIDKGTLFDTIDQKWEIRNEEDYSLYIDEVDIKAQHNCYPITNGFPYPIEYDYKVKITPDKWYGPSSPEKKDIELYMMELEEELKKENILYEIKCVLLDNCSVLSGEVAYFEDYGSASINDTAGRIHLIDIDQDECDDVFMEKVNNVYNSNGTDFIAMVTNPSFVNTLNTSVKGMFISRYDGEKIKKYLENNETVYIEIDEESFITDTQVTLKVYHIEQQQLLTRYIYLIEMDKIFEKNLNLQPRYVAKVVESVVKNTWKKNYPYRAYAFLYSDFNNNIINGVNINENTYLCTVQSIMGDKSKWDERIENPPIYTTVPIPGFCITGKKGAEIRDSIENCNDVIVRFKMVPRLTLEAESYNVIGKINNYFTNKVVIVSAHYDGFWAQGAIDDAAGVAAVYGVAKYIKDHNITPKFDIKFIAFGGEEYFRTRGANHYVWKHAIDPKYGGEGDEWGKIIAVIELDPIALNTKQYYEENPPIPLELLIHPPDDNSEDEYYNILYNVANPDDYTDKTNYSTYAPDFKNADIPGGDTRPFRPLFEGGVPLANWIINLGRYEKLEKEEDWEAYWKILSIFDHRGGGANFEYGDAISKVDYNDLYETTRIAIRLVDYFSKFDTKLDFNNDCVYTQLDLDGDSQYDSVRIGYAVDSNITSGGQVDSIIYLNGQPQTSNFTTGSFTIGENETVYGNLTVTLPYNGTAGGCDIRVYLKNYQGDEEDFDNSTIYLYPYNDSIAGFTWEVNDSNLKMVNFTDCSTPSLGATINC